MARASEEQRHLGVIVVKPELLLDVCANLVSFFQYLLPVDLPVSWYHFLGEVLYALGTLQLAEPVT